MVVAVAFGAGVAVGVAAVVVVAWWATDEESGTLRELREDARRQYG